MSSGNLLPICFQCRHLRGLEVGVGWACDAYWRGIPTEILSSHHDHRLPFEGDGGVVFEPRQAEDADFNESEHPRDEDGKFGSKGGGTSGGASSGKVEVPELSQHQAHLSAVRMFNGGKLDESRSLGVLKSISDEGGVGDLPSSRYALNRGLKAIGREDARHYVSGVDVSKLSDDDIEAALQAGGYDWQSSASFAGTDSYVAEFMRDVTSEEGQRQIAKMYADMPANDRGPGKTKMRESWAGAAVETLRGDVLDEMAGIEPADGLKMFSSDYEEARHQFFQTWAITGGTAAYRRGYAALGDYDGNSGKDFWLGKKPLSDSEKVPSANLKRTLELLHDDTASFYTKKLTKKSNPDPDLSKVFVKVRRGIGGHFDEYSPAPIESWTTDARTPDRFGKMMASRDKKYSVLSAEVQLDHVLFSYESAAGQSGWPPEEALKGKKEFVILGGGLHNLTVDKK